MFYQKLTKQLLVQFHFYKKEEQSHFIASYRCKETHNIKQHKKIKQCQEHKAARREYTTDSRHTLFWCLWHSPNCTCTVSTLMDLLVCYEYFIFYSCIVLIKILIVQSIDFCFHFIKQPQWKPYVNYNENAAHLPWSISLKSLKNELIVQSYHELYIYIYRVTNIYCKSKTSLRLHHRVVTQILHH